MDKMNSSAWPSQVLTLFDGTLIKYIVETSEVRRGASKLVLSKLEAHIARDEPSYRNLNVDIATARKIIEAVLRHPQRVVMGRKTMDLYGPEGRGIRLRRATLEFLTFLEAARATR